jgi:hypothetical protein
MSTDGRPRRNQSDSTASKIGSLFSSPSDAAGGMMTPPLVDPFWASSRPKEVPEPSNPDIGAPSTGCSVFSPDHAGMGCVPGSPQAAG